MSGVIQDFETMKKILSGTCLCTKIRYEVPDDFEYSLICHCSECRRATGSAYKPFAGIRTEALSLVAGEGSVMKYGDDQAHDVHCRNCGSLLYSVVRDGAYVHVSLGTLEDEPGIRPSAYIFVASKAGWEAITDDLPQYAELP